MSNWVIWVTVWIILQVMVKIIKGIQVRERGDLTHSATTLVIGYSLWGVFMLSSLYMAGLYS